MAISRVPATVLWNTGGKYRMPVHWHSRLWRSLMDYAPFRLCYAESEDGINWVKPNLGLYSWEGSAANNMLMDTARTKTAEACSLIPRPRPGQRFKLLAWLHDKIGDRIRGRQCTERLRTLYLYLSPTGCDGNCIPTASVPV